MNFFASKSFLLFFLFLYFLSAGCGKKEHGESIIFTPSSGPIGSLVTITGGDFSSTLSVAIGGTSALVIDSSSSFLLAMVMPGASSNKVQVVTAEDGALAGPDNFSVLASTAVASQQGAKLLGTGAVGAGRQGYATSLSADGNTLLIGGYSDNTNSGAVWVFTRSGGVWTQQGAKLVGTGAVGAAAQGYAVSLSADGNTALVGGYGDNSNRGAAWIFTRSSGVWTQQGDKLVGSGAVGIAGQGSAVSLSADGNTALVGGYSDNNNSGAAWIFTRSSGVWTQKGDKLVGSGAVGAGYQGSALSLSADGNTALIGGYNDNTATGATWVFIQSNGLWTQEGTKLVGTGATGAASQGIAVSLSADGNTALIGGQGDDTNIGAAWVFTRSSSTWTQQGAKFFGTGATGSAYQGKGVSLSADGNTALIGGYNDNAASGAVWFFTRSAGVWSQQGTKFVGTGAGGAGAQGLGLSLSADGNTAAVGGFGDSTNIGATWIYVP